MYTYIWPFLMGSIIDNKNISSKYSHIWPISKRYHIYRTHIEQSSYTYLPMSSQLQTYLRYTSDILPIYHRFHLYLRYVTNIQCRDDVDKSDIDNRHRKQIQHRLSTSEMNLTSIYRSIYRPIYRYIEDIVISLQVDQWRPCLSRGALNGH